MLKYFGGAFEVGLLSWFSWLCLGGGELERWPSARDQAPGGLDPTALLPSSCSDGGVVLLPSSRCGMAFAQGRLELARVCLASPRPCRSCARTSQGRQAEGPEIPVDLSCSTQDPRKGLALGRPTGTEGGDPPSSPHSCPIPQDPPSCRSGPSSPAPSLISSLCPSLHSSPVVSQRRRASPTASPWWVLFPFLGMSIRLLFHGTFRLIAQVSAQLSPPKKGFPDDLIQRRDPVTGHLSPFLVFFIIPGLF